MSWFPVDDAFHSHPKARKAGMEAVGLWTLAGSHCMAYLTDGFVADWWVKEKPKGPTLARRLVNAELWRVGEKGDEKGFWFHDWKPECTKAHVLAAREKARQRKAKSRESQRESRVTDDVSSASCLVPTQPNPTQPINPLVDLGGRVTSVDANGPRPQCPDHEDNYDGPCRRCKRRREWDEANAGVLAATELDRKRALKELRENCPRCGGTNTYTDEAGETRKCTPHLEAQHA
ncbi:hypothetical protein [Mycolicibacterium conceptionense]|uniref:hypothetical protein n=1 Tax=Mycolicibacterium conceptionense TaxID=451644 RepID=UPI000A56A4FC|nr:hypothetical protein [Mycolicibacterium conceptionense]